MAKVILHAVGQTWEVEVPVGSSILEAAQKVDAPAPGMTHEEHG